MWLPEVGFPQRPHLVLAADVPDGEGDALGVAGVELHLLTVEAHGGLRVHVLAELEVVQQRRLAGVLQAHKNQLYGGASSHGLSASPLQRHHSCLWAGSGPENCTDKSQSSKQCKEKQDTIHNI